MRSVSDLQARVLHDANALDRFLRALTIHVTSMFRDGDFYRTFRNQVLPQLHRFSPDLSMPSGILKPGMPKRFTWI